MTPAPTPPSGESAPPSLEERGRWVVPIREHHPFGSYAEHGLRGADGVIFLGLPRLAGWKPFGWLCLAHQAYVKEVEEWLAENDDPREVAVLDVATGRRVTIWARRDHAPIYPASSLAADELARLRAEVARLTAQRDAAEARAERYRMALEKIAQEDTRDAEWLRFISRRALTEGADHAEH